MNDRPTVFLLMPFAKDLEWLKRDLMSAGELASMTVSRADDIFRGGAVIEQIRESIDEADVVVAVVTGRNANVFYELGIADTLGHKPILVAEDSTHLPFDVQHFRAHFYGKEASSTRKNFVDRLKQALVETARAGRSVAKPSSTQVPAKAKLDASVRKQSSGSYTFEVVNAGDVTLSEITWSIPTESHWLVRLEELANYPVRLLEPGDSIRTYLIATMGTHASTEISLRALRPDGSLYERVQPVSLLG